MSSNETSDFEAGVSVVVSSVGFGGTVVSSGEATQNSS